MSADEVSIAAQTVGGFLEVLSSDAPTPGGGAAAGVAGAAGASLIAMAARLTVGRKGYEEVDARMREVIVRCEAIRDSFLELADRDAHAFDAVMDAFKMPKETEEQKSERSAAIQAGYGLAAQVPLECLRTAVTAMPIAVETTANGNVQAASDGLSGAALLHSTALCTAANVHINAVALKDEVRRGELLREIAALRADADEALAEALAAFERRMA
ncbi:MAG: cyclodeaminase/cyclohydrolase family protein [Actinobacteria bacterium]|nr:cyclodeaminase/cyclohydrolase family protein [Actinomycetota bacterium]